jgi:hypothetical protein
VRSDIYEFLLKNFTQQLQQNKPIDELAGSVTSSPN